jgi:cytochrome c5
MRPHLLLPLLLPPLLFAFGTALAAPAQRGAPAGGEVVVPESKTGAPAAPVPTELPRGELLYENHCQGCHVSRLHVREQRRATTRAALRAWIVRWANELKLGWGEAEVDDVTDYLNRRYYRLPPPAAK